MHHHPQLGYLFLNPNFPGKLYVKQMKFMGVKWMASG